MDVMIECVISRIKYGSNKKCCKMVLETMKKNMVRSYLSSNTSLIYNDDNAFLKIYDNRKLTYKLFQNEMNAYKKIETINELKPYVPKLLDSSDNYKLSKVLFLLIENRGIDGIELLNNNNMTFMNWKNFLVDISTTINILHENNIMHCDIKPENTTFSIKTGHWSIIDFGFTNRERNNSIFFGTIPYCSPHTGNCLINARTTTLTSGRLACVDDIYAFAISALSLFGYYHNSMENDSCIKFNISQLVSIYNGNLDVLNRQFMPTGILYDDWLKNILKVLSSIILSQQQTSSRIMVWNKPTLSCSFHGHNHLPCDVKYDITEYWSEFNTIIKNYKK